MIKIVEEMGAFHFLYCEKKLPILIYGTALDGRTFGEYLSAKQMNLVGYIDKNADYMENKLNGVSVKKLEDIELNEEYYILLTAKTDKVAREMIDKIKECNINGIVFTWKAFCFENDISEKKFSPDMFAKTVPWMYYNIYGNMVNEKYVNITRNLERTKYVYNEKYYRVKAIRSKYHNIDDYGKRKTYYQPICDRKIHIFGHSVALGVGVEDKDTISSQLQLLINEKCNTLYEVNTYGLPAGNIREQFQWMKEVALKKEDIVIVMPFLWVKIAPEDRKKYTTATLLEYHMFYCKKIVNYCEERGVKCYFIYFPSCADLQENTLAEKTWLTVMNQEKGKGDLWAVHKLAIWGEKFLHGKIFNLISTVEENHLKINFFTDLKHYSPEGNRIIAEELYSILFDKYDIELEAPKFADLEAYLEKNKLFRKYPFIWDKEWRDYEAYLLEHKQEGIAGTIVMNANPFTKGHKYLVEYAAAKVDTLYVFVIEEERSEISFKDRFNMVNLGIRESRFKNIVVLHSCYYFSSYQTFSEYFNFKYSAIEQDEKEQIDCSKDLEIFVELVAPILNIKYRFVGKEPYSGVTRIYNEQMKKILPEYGIECIEIDRATVEGENYISANKVRRAWLEQDIEVLETMLPETTLNYMKEHKIILKSL